MNIHGALIPMQLFTLHRYGDFLIDLLLLLIRDLGKAALLFLFCFFFFFALPN